MNNRLTESVNQDIVMNTVQGDTMEQNKIQIYQTPAGKVRLEVALDQDMVWLSQAQMVDLFGRDQSVVPRHIRNALAEGEVSEKSNMQKMHIANLDSCLRRPTIAATVR